MNQNAESWMMDGLKDGKTRRQGDKEFFLYQGRKVQDGGRGRGRQKKGECDLFYGSR